MAEPLTLFGYEYSVYTRIVRMALMELELSAQYHEVDPFAQPKDATLADITPFHRVPVLRHGAFTLTETAAILRYLDAASPCESLIPPDPQASARMFQVIGVMDCYGYVPLVRQVFAQAVFRPFVNEPADPQVIAEGLAAARPVLEALDQIATEGLVLNGQMTLADLHLAPMIAYFDMAAEGRAMLGSYPHLTGWWDVAKTWRLLAHTDPFGRKTLA